MKGVVAHFGKHAFTLSLREVDEKIDTTLCFSSSDPTLCKQISVLPQISNYAFKLNSNFCSDMVRGIKICTLEPDKTNVHEFPKSGGGKKSKRLSACDLTVYDPLALNFIIF